MPNSLPAALTFADLITAPDGCWYDDTSGPSITLAADAGGASATANVEAATARTAANARRRARVRGRGTGKAPKPGGSIRTRATASSPPCHPRPFGPAPLATPPRIARTEGDRTGRPGLPDIRPKVRSRGSPAAAR